VLTGLGGAGKSTLLAQFAKETYAAQAATVVILDFDRPGIDPRDRYWLEGEIARQVGYQYPQVAQQLRQRRQEARQQKAEVEERVEKWTSQSVSDERGLRGLLFDVQSALMSVGAGGRPVLLVLDTFEEVAQRDLVERVCEWLSEIAERFTPMPLRVIFSGRLYDPTPPVDTVPDAPRVPEALRKFNVNEAIEVSELEPEVAEQYLTKLGVPPSIAVRLARSDVLPRRPLELKLLAKLVENSNLDVDELESQLREGGEAAGELFGGLIYRRVLLRIGDEVARSLAFPGLVLRYVTTDL